MSEVIQKTVALPPWLQAMRDAAQGAIQAEDMAKIVKAQVKKARKGDIQSARFVMDQVVGEQFKGATFVQENHYHGVGGQPVQREQKPAPTGDGLRREMQNVGEAVAVARDAVAEAWSILDEGRNWRDAEGHLVKALDAIRQAKDAR